MLFPLIFFSTLIVMLWRPASLVSMAFYLMIFLFFIYVLDGFKFYPKRLQKSVLVFFLGTFLAFGIMFSQNFTLPSFKGFSGPEGGIGTDDLFFYMQAKEHPDQDLIDASNQRAFYSKPHSYSLFLRTLIAPLNEINPEISDFIFINVLAYSLLPFFVKGISVRIIRSPKINELIFWLCLLYPTIWANSLILIRDGWATTLTWGALFFLISKRYALALVLLATLFYIRIASGMQAALICLFLLPYIFENKTKLVFVYLLFFCLSLFTLPFAFEYIMSKGLGDNIFFRESFVEGFIGRVGGDESNLYRILNLPFYYRIPLSMAFFLFLPFFNLQVSNFGVIIPRAILGQVSALLNLIIIIPLFSGIIKAFKSKGIARALCIALFLILFIIGNISMQPRHKSLIDPLIFIIAGMGISRNKGLFIFFGGIISLALFTIQLIKLSGRAF